MKKVTVRVDGYTVVSERLGLAVTAALRRATKHLPWSHWGDWDRRAELGERVADEVMSELCEIARFDEIRRPAAPRKARSARTKVQSA